MTFDHDICDLDLDCKVAKFAAPQGTRAYQISSVQVSALLGKIMANVKVMEKYNKQGDKMCGFSRYMCVPNIKCVSALSEIYCQS